MMKPTTSILTFAALAVATSLPGYAQQHAHQARVQTPFVYYFPNYAAFAQHAEHVGDAPNEYYEQFAEGAEHIGDDSACDSGDADLCTGGPDCTASVCVPGCTCPKCRKGFWANAEYLMWFPKGRQFPPLVTTSPNGTDRDAAGVLGQPDTSILFGGETIGNGLKSGGRLDFGTWFDTCRTVGAGGRFYGLQGDDTAFSDSSGGDPIIAHPFFNLLLNQEDAVLVAFSNTVVVPNEFVTSGSTSIRTSSDFLGAEAYLRVFGHRAHSCRLDVIGGYHFLRLDDGIAIRDDIVSGPDNGLVVEGTVFEIDDFFDTTNIFHGGQVGILGDYRCGNISVDFLVKFSVGNMHQSVTIGGSQVITEPGGPPIASAGGLFAQPSNIGTYQRDRTVFVPEFGVTLGYDLTYQWKATIGYSLIWWNEVALAGDQIDRVINLSQANGGVLIGDPRPEFSFRTSDYWVQGLNFGLVCQY